MPEIMKSIDVLDRVHILVFQPVSGHFDVTFECMEKDKRLVFDEGALKTLNEKIIDLCRDKNAADPNTRGYIEEFTGRMLKEYYKLGLAVIEDVPDAIEDHYHKLRKIKPVKKD